MNLFNAQNVTMTTDEAEVDVESEEKDQVTMNIIEKPMEVLTCEQQDKPYFLPHPINSNQFYVCVKEQMFLLNCSIDYQFDNETKQCVKKINQSLFILNASEKKQRKYLCNLAPKKPYLMAHETNCGWYYVVRVDTTGERVLNSCPMPQLFDIQTLQCKNYTEVKCKDRFEPKDACKLLMNSRFSSRFDIVLGDYQIRSAAHAYPCSYLPSCKNRSDGLYPDRLRDCRMYFRCTSERSSESYSCSQDTLPLGERFSFEEQRCLPAQHVQCVNDEHKPLI